MDCNDNLMDCDARYGQDKKSRLQGQAFDKTVTCDAGERMLGQYCTKSSGDWDWTWDSFPP